MLRIPEPKFISNLANRFTIIKNPFLSDVYHFCLYVVLRRCASFFFDQVTGRNETGNTMWFRRHDEYGDKGKAGSCCA